MAALDTPKTLRYMIRRNNTLNQKVIQNKSTMRTIKLIKFM